MQSEFEVRYIFDLPKNTKHPFLFLVNLLSFITLKPKVCPEVLIYQYLLLWHPVKTPLRTHSRKKCHKEIQLCRKRNQTNYRESTLPVMYTSREQRNLLCKVFYMFFASWNSNFFEQMTSLCCSSQTVFEDY